MTEWHPLRSLEGNDSELSKMWKELDKSAEIVGKDIATNSPATMPTLDHSSMADFFSVYEPSDDTYLLIDAIKYDLFTEYSSDSSSIHDEEDGSSERDKESQVINNAALKCYYKILQENIESDGENETISYGSDNETVKQVLEIEEFSSDQSTKILSRLRQLKRLDEIKTVMEIGTGSGVPITYLSKQLLAEKPRPLPDYKGNSTFSVIATDLNPLALDFAKKTATENGVIPSNEESNTVSIQSIEFIECDLATPLLEDREGTIDVLVFNPPYVPTEDSEVSGNGIEISWAGGKDGRLVVDRALPQLAKLLRKATGVCYMITVDDNLPAELATILKEKHGLKMGPLVRRRARNEYLSVQKISWIASS